jgi:hypothetical protein
VVAQFDDYEKFVILSEAKDLLFAGSHSNVHSLLFSLTHDAKFKLSHYFLASAVDNAASTPLISFSG